MMICVYCETVSDFPFGFCEECDLMDGIVPFEGEDDNEEYIDYYAEASLFGWEN